MHNTEYTRQNVRHCTYINHIAYVYIHLAKMSKRCPGLSKVTGPEESQCQVSLEKDEGSQVGTGVSYIINYYHHVSNVCTPNACNSTSRDGS